jgi:glycine C-acetyltransferase
MHKGLSEIYPSKLQILFAKGIQLIKLENYAKKKLASIRRESLYRRLNTIATIKKMRIQIDGNRAINFCSNDYLGLSQNPAVLEAAKTNLYQVSQCSSRLVSGNSPDIQMLEDILSNHRKTECALVYSTGYMANLGVLTAIADKNSVIYSDEFNHSSIIDGCRLSGATVKVFSHNNVNDLHRLIDTDKNSNSIRKFIITEGIFSMNGNIANLSEICQLAKDTNAITILDDAHGDFILGRSKNCSGTADLLGVSRLIDVHISSLSKAIGCFGGYIAASHSIRELLINKSRQLIYTSAIPSHLCRAAVASISVASTGLTQTKLRKNIEYFVNALRKLDLVTANYSSPIIPIMVGDEKTTVSISDYLLKKGVFIQAIRFPTVRKRRAQLRVSLTAVHNTEQLDFALSCLEIIGRRYKLF